METKPIHITDAEFEEKVLNADLPVLVDFWAPWCGPCRMIAPLLDNIAEDYAGRVLIVKVNALWRSGHTDSARILGWKAHPRACRRGAGAASS